ncbi:hypothetical protein LJR168_001657 [Pseudoxanthomonas sp. LjRoot168]|uniref:hypothetical protein n=1 Tax=unclassified Pseudoxanthomonas TaxID=2645906 RepID=UPI00260E2B06|nr:hypothetical protein [uncultured Pseudoxanthomonas sp.]
MAKRNPPPWQRPAPIRRGGPSTLSPAQVEEARARAVAAGRRYPNLIDNMHVAAKARRVSGVGETARDEAE